MPRKAKNGAKAPQRSKTVKTKKNKIAGAIGTSVGSMLGSKFGPVGSKVGGAIGNLAANYFARIFGKGDYTGHAVEHNSLIIPKQADRVPMFGTEDGAIRVRHREYLGEISGDLIFRNLPLVINPANLQMMPWLATFAQSFEQYRIMGMIFEFKSTSGNFGITNPALGSIIMATQYNSRTRPFATKQQMLNHYFSGSARASEDLIHPIECKDSFDPLKVYYIRNTDEATNVNFDARMEDYTVFNIATQGQPSAYILGELWISYDLMLIKPRLRSGASGLIIDPQSPGKDPMTTAVHVPEWPRFRFQPKEEEAKDPQ